MTKDMFMYAYKMASEGAILLQQDLDILQVRHKGSTVKGKPERVILNWGSSHLPSELLKCRVLNHPMMVGNVIDKLQGYRLLEDACRIPEWTQRQQTARAWLNEGITVLARTILDGSRGEGIVVIEPGTELPDAPAYTKYIPKTAEYRIHIVNDKVIGYQQKIRDPEREPSNWKIRNHESGFILVPMRKTKPPEDVLSQALKAVDRSGLDFGAVDVGYVSSTDKAWVIEINSAPWLNGEFSKLYANAIKELVA